MKFIIVYKFKEVCQCFCGYIKYYNIRYPLFGIAEDPNTDGVKRYKSKEEALKELNLINAKFASRGLHPKVSLRL